MISCCAEFQYDQRVRRIWGESVLQLLNYSLLACLIWYPTPQLGRTSLSRLHIELAERPLNVVASWLGLQEEQKLQSLM